MELRFAVGSGLLVALLVFAAMLGESGLTGNLLLPAGELPTYETRFESISSALFSQPNVTQTIDGKLWVAWYSSSSACAPSDLVSQPNCPVDGVNGSLNCMVSDEFSQVGLNDSVGFGSSIDDALGYFTGSTGTWDGAPCFGVYFPAFTMRALGVGLGRDAYGLLPPIAIASSDPPGSTIEVPGNGSATASITMSEAPTSIVWYLDCAPFRNDTAWVELSSDGIGRASVLAVAIERDGSTDERSWSLIRTSPNASIVSSDPSSPVHATEGVVTTFSVALSDQRAASRVSWSLDGLALSNGSSISLVPSVGTHDMAASIDGSNASWTLVVSAALAQGGGSSGGSSGGGSASVSSRSGSASGGGSGAALDASGAANATRAEGSSASSGGSSRSARAFGDRCERASRAAAAAR